MPAPSPTHRRICEAATQHFAVKGYDGASLAEIAEMVGIRKASLYSHFAGKDALFTRILSDAIAAETDFARETIGNGDGTPGGGYPVALAGRYERSVHLRYLLRTVYLPPASLRGIIDTAYVGFLDAIAACFRRRFEHSFADRYASDDVEIFAAAYVGLVESLFVEITYAGPISMERRRAAMWSVFTDSLSYRATRRAGTAT